MTKKTAQQEWEAKLAREGLTPDAGKGNKDIHLADLARIGRRNRPDGYDPGKDLYDSGGPLSADDSEQCDARIGLDAVIRNPSLLGRLRGGTEKKG